MADISTNINRAIADFDSIRTAIENKGVTVGNVPTNTYADKISEIGGGGDRHYILKNFNEISDITVFGWTGYRNSNGIIFIRNYGYAQQAYTVAAVDFSGKSKLCCEIMADAYKFYQAGVTPTVELQIMNAPVSSDTRDASRRYATNRDYIVKSAALGMSDLTTDGTTYKYGAGVIEIDVSDISSGYIAIDVIGCMCYIANIWTE